MKGERYLQGTKQPRCRALTATRIQCSYQARGYTYGIAMCKIHKKRVQVGMRETAYLDVE